MEASIKKRFDALEDRRVAFMGRVRALTPEQQAAQPAPGLFSPAEVVKHFALVENGNLQFLRNTPPSTLKDRKPRVGFIFNQVVKAGQSASKRLPTLPYMIPREAVDLDAAGKEWAAARAELTTYLEAVQAPDKAFCKFTFFFGLASADQFLTIMESHMHYHEVWFPGG